MLWLSIASSSCCEGWDAVVEHCFQQLLRGMGCCGWALLPAAAARDGMLWLGIASSGAAWHGVQVCAPHERAVAWLLPSPAHCRTGAASGLRGARTRWRRSSLRMVRRKGARQSLALPPMHSHGVNCSMDPHPAWHARQAAAGLPPSETRAATALPRRILREHAVAGWVKAAGAAGWANMDGGGGCIGVAAGMSIGSSSALIPANRELRLAGWLEWLTAALRVAGERP